MRLSFRYHDRISKTLFTLRYIYNHVPLIDGCMTSIAEGRDIVDPDFTKLYISTTMEMRDLHKSSTYVQKAFSQCFVSVFQNLRTKDKRDKNYVRTYALLPFHFLTDKFQVTTQHSDFT